MGMFAAIGSLLASGLSVYGQLAAGKQQEEAYQQRADVLMEDADAADLDALVYRKASREEERELRLYGKRLEAQQIVDFQGIGGLLVRAQTRSQIDTEAEFISAEGRRREGSIRSEANRMRSRAGFEEKLGASARSASYWKAGTTLLAGGSRYLKARETA